MNSDAVLPPASLHKEVSTYPLSPLQQGMLYHQFVSREAGVDVVQLIVSLREAIQPDRLRLAWENVTARHDVLRTFFRWEGRDVPEQVVLDKVHLPWREYDWRHVPPENRESHLTAFLEEDRLCGVALGHVVSWRLALLRRGEDDFCLVWTIHHAVMDGRSFLTVLREAFAIYDALDRMDRPTLPEVRPYREFIEWLGAQDFSRSETFWRARLQGFTTPTSLPLDGVDVDPVAQRKSKKQDCEIRLDAESTTKLRAFARASRITLNTMVQGAWALLLSRTGGGEDIVFGATRACRRSSIEGSESLVGLLINTLPVRVKVHAGMELVPWLKELREQWVAMRDHEHSPLVQVHGWSDVPRGTPLFQSIVVFEKFHINEALRSRGKAWLHRETSLLEQSNFPLTFAVHDGEQLWLKIGYHTDHYSAAVARHLLEQLRTLLETMADSPNLRLGDLLRPSAGERTRMLVDWNHTEKEYPLQCIHRLVEAQVERSPGKVAVTFGKTQCTYEELNRKANHVANVLREKGVVNGAFVPLLFERGLEVIIAELAVMKAGAAFVPLDPQWPEMRLQSILSNLSPVVLLAGKTLRQQAAGLCENSVVVAWDDPAWSKRSPAVETQITDPIYMIHTSGSTGSPKGAVNHHAGIANRFFNMNDRYGCGSDDVILAISAYVFDSSLWQFFWPLINGARVVIPSPGGAFDPERLVELMAAEKVTMTDFVPSLLAGVTDHLEENSVPASALHLLRHVLVGGEAMNPGVTYRFKARLPGAAVTNTYGPTETSIGVIFHEVGQEPRDTIPIGKPFYNVKAIILGENLGLLPVGVPGDLYVGGICVGMGYYRDEEATRAVFIPNPFPELACQRLYRTGDRARYLPDGNILFLGRSDSQVQVRGFRVEPGEIEHALSAHPSIAECAVVQRETGVLRGQLAAYFTTSGKEAPETDALRDFLHLRIPRHIVPSVFVRVESLPCNPNGKVDRKALVQWPEPELAVQGASSPDVTPLEKYLAAIWENVLGITGIGPRDNFFFLGGHSLKAVRVVSEIRKALGIKLQVRSLIESPTLALLAGTVAALLDEKKKDVRGSAPAHSGAAHQFIVPLRVGGGAAPLFIIPGGYGGENEILVFASLVEHLAPGRRVYAIQSLAMDDRWLMPSSLDGQAIAVLESLRAVHTEGPFVLLGECVGATLAMEIARLAEETGMSCSVVILDAPSLSRDAARKNDATPLAGSETPALPACIVKYYRLLMEWMPAPIRGALHLVLSSGNAINRELLAGEWGGISTTDFQIHQVSGTHDSYIREAAAETAVVIDDILNRIPGTGVINSTTAAGRDRCAHFS